MCRRHSPGQAAARLRRCDAAKTSHPTPASMKTTATELCLREAEGGGRVATQELDRKRSTPRRSGRRRSGRLGASGRASATADREPAHHEDS